MPGHLIKASRKTEGRKNNREGREKQVGGTEGKGLRVKGKG